MIAKLETADLRALGPRSVPSVAVAGIRVPLVKHGIGGNRTNWHAQLPVFSQHFACVAWNASVYGSSDDYDGEFARHDFVAESLPVLDHSRALRAHQLGLSMGRRIAMRTAFLHLQRVAVAAPRLLAVVDRAHLGRAAAVAQELRAGGRIAGGAATGFAPLD